MSQDTCYQITKNSKPPQIKLRPSIEFRLRGEAESSQGNVSVAPSPGCSRNTGLVAISLCWENRAWRAGGARSRFFRSGHQCRGPVTQGGQGRGAAAARLKPKGTEGLSPSSFAVRGKPDLRALQTIWETGACGFHEPNRRRARAKVTNAALASALVPVPNCPQWILFIHF